MERNLLFEKRAMCSFAGTRPVRPMHGVSLHFLPQSVDVGVIHINPVSSGGRDLGTYFQFNVHAAREMANALLKLCDAAEQTKK